MHLIEERLLKQLKKCLCLNIEDTEAFHSLTLGTLSPEFYQDPSVIQYGDGHWRDAKLFNLRLALEHYLASNHSQKCLKNFENALMAVPSPTFTFKSTFPNKLLHKKAAGTYLMPIPSELIRQIYQLEDPLLSNLLQKHFPMPSAQLFEGGIIPAVIQQRDAAILTTVNKIDIKTIEPHVVKIQRRLRMNKRYREEVNRIAERDEFYLKSNYLSAEDLYSSSGNCQTPVQIRQWAEELLKDASMPYKPKCDLMLSARIKDVAKKVAAFSTVIHITSEKAIQSVFDESLFSRRILMDLYMNYEPAALHMTDLLNGDTNVVCLGPQDIDPKARGGLVIEFDLPKLIKNKPSAFYKQRDLEFGLNRIRHVSLGKEKISFNHTWLEGSGDPTNTYLTIIDSLNGLNKIVEAPKSSFIAYNLEQMHEVLTLNFFRFMDKMSDLKGNIDHAYIDNFYRKVSQLTDKELLVFLTDLEKNMTDTAEFNFYGAHQVDFSTLISITARYRGYSLNVPKFINALEQSNIDELQQARIKIPEIFQSYRFLDYLLLKVQHSDIRYYLDDLRKQCRTPNWVQHIPLIIPEKFKLSWEISSLSDTRKQEPLVATIKKETNTVALLLEPTHSIPVILEGTVVTEKHEVVAPFQIAPNNGASTDNLIHTSIDDIVTVHDPLLEVITENPVQENVFDKAFQNPEAQLSKQSEQFIKAEEVDVAKEQSRQEINNNIKGTKSHENINIQDTRLETSIYQPLTNSNYFLALIDRDKKLSQLKNSTTLCAPDPIWIDAIEHVARKKITIGLIHDLLLLQIFKENKLSLTSNFSSEETKHYFSSKEEVENYKKELEKFYRNAIAIRLSDAPAQKKCENLIEAAENSFPHRDYGKRLLADFFIVLSSFVLIGLAIGGLRLATGHTFFFSQESTQRQKDFMLLLTNPIQACDNTEKVPEALFTALSHKFH